jgi:hypothetical protein
LVWLVTGSEKSPDGGEIEPSSVTEPVSPASVVTLAARS